MHPATPSSTAYADVLRAAELLRAAERPLRILRTLAWPTDVAARFFAQGARELPQVTYRPPDVSGTLEAIGQARRELGRRGGSEAHRWLRRTADDLERSARMLAAVGTAEFYVHAVELYGAPTTPLSDGLATSLALAQQLDSTLTSLSVPRHAPHLGHDALYVAERMRAVCRRHFGEASPDVVLESALSANAVAGPARIRLREGARFSDRDIVQLIQHEAFIHVATSINGRAQTALPILASSHAGTTRTQEGLAVFAEFISSNLDPRRLRRLSARVLGIQMAVEGADFLDLYRFFLEREGQPEQAFENARRVVRGGLLTGGAPFTKDTVYLDGLLRVHNFLRAAVQEGRDDCLLLLVSGKLDLEDVPALCELTHAGLCVPPRFVPPWLSDPGALLAYLAYSGFLNGIKLGRVRSHFAKLFAKAPRVDIQIKTG